MKRQAYNSGIFFPIYLHVRLQFEHVRHFSALCYWLLKGVPNGDKYLRTGPGFFRNGLSLMDGISDLGRRERKGGISGPEIFFWASRMDGVVYFALYLLLRREVEMRDHERVWDYGGEKAFSCISIWILLRRCVAVIEEYLPWCYVARLQGREERWRDDVKRYEKK